MTEPTPAHDSGRPDPALHGQRHAEDQIGQEQLGQEQLGYAAGARGDSAATGRRREAADTRREVVQLEAEVAALRLRLAEQPRRFRDMEERSVALQRRVEDLMTRNERLTSTLGEAREQLVRLRAEVDRLAMTPNSYGIFLQVREDDAVDIMQSGRKMRVSMSPSIDPERLRPGQEVMLNEALNVVAAGDFERTGEVVQVKDLLGADRALVVGRGDEERVVTLAGPLLPEAMAEAPLRIGDALSLDTRSGIAFERIPKAEVEELVLEEVPDIEYTDIGGLLDQIEQIRDSVELPFAHPDIYREHGLKPPKGILLYGPPGCGKTLIAKAVARSLARQSAQAKGIEETPSFFLNVKGPELLNKYVGETERHIRLIFARAREKASAGTPVVVFFDEMESLFRTRGSGVSSDVETTIVPQLLAEIDGVERLENVIVIGASNREDMIDPAILRPGRLDVKIKIHRPDAEAARDIFSKYLTTNLPLHADDLAEHSGSAQACVDAMIQAAVERMYVESPQNQFLEVTYAGGDKEILYFKDFNSGAMIANIVDRAKKMAIKDLLTNQQKGLRVEHLLTACADEFHENEDLPNTTNPDDWARVSGRKGERIVYIRTIVQGKTGSEPGRSIDNVTNTGQYL